MESKERLLYLKEILNEQYRLLSENVMELGKAKAIADPSDAYRYNYNYDKKSRELKILEDEIRQIEQKLVKDDYSIDEKIMNIESTHFLYLIDTLVNGRQFIKNSMRF